MRGKSLTKSFLTLCMALAVGMSGQVFAQEDEFTLEEIVVTAEKREAQLQKIPMDISVVRPDELERLNVHQIEDLDKLLPDLKITRSQGGILKIQMRDVGGNTEGRGGVTTDYDNPTQETTVAVHIDGVQLTRSDGLEGKLYDLERVETLKGPQGTLYGRGSISGSINMVSKRPDIGNFGGNITLEYGSYDRRRFAAGLNIPATDKLAFRLSGNIISREGYDDAGVSNQNMWGVRGSLRWEPTDDQSLVVALDTDKTKNRNGDSTGFLYGTVGDLKIVPNPDPGLPESYAPYNKGGIIDSAYKVKWWLGDLTPEMADQQYTDNKSWGLNTTYDNELDFAYLTIQYGYRSSRNVRSYIDVSGTRPTIMPVGTIITQSRYPARTYDPETGLFTEAVDVNDDDVEDMSETNVPLTPALEPIQGYTISRTQTYSYSIPGNTPVTELMLVPSTNPPFLSNYSETLSKMYSAEARLASKETVAGGDTYEWIGGVLHMHDYVLEEASITNSAYRRNTLTETALFGQASYAPFWGLNLTGGYRFTWDHKQFYGLTNSGGEGTASSARSNNERFALPLDLDDAINSSYKWEHQTYKLNLSWQATENIMPYVQYSKGVKTGNIDGQGNSVDPETLGSWEAGMRTRLFNGRLQINTTGYYYEYKNSMASATIFQCLRPDDRGESDSCLNAEGNVGFAFGVNPNLHMPVDPNDLSKGYRYISGAAVNIGGTEQTGVNVNATWLITPADTLTVSGSKSSNKYVNYSMNRAQQDYARKAWSQYDGQTIIIDGEEQVVETYADSGHNIYSRVYEDWSGSRFGGGINANVSYNHTWFVGTDLLIMNTTGFYTGKGIDQVMRPSQTSSGGEWGDLEYSMPGNPDYWMFDASVTYTSTKWVGEGKRWDLRLYVNNLLDKKIIGRRFQDYVGTVGSYMGTYDVFNPDSYLVIYSYAEPRTFGLTFTLNF
ncbi:MAG: TonB-dependent receptor [Desulfatiglans sp.]|nr:TonB-dependent receptor [Desulfatiglans sp.]